MLGGIDIGTDTIVVATDAGTTGYASPATHRDEQDRAETATAVEQFLADRLDEQLSDTPGSDTRLGYVDRDTDVSTEFVRAGDTHDVGFERVDPGMAVCYDVLGAEPTGLGVALDGEAAVATLAVGGFPVATARLTHGAQWYDVPGDAGGAGPRSAWAGAQFEALLEDLAVEIAATAPAVDDAIGVALGGPATPETVGDVEALLEAALYTEISSVTVAGRPAAALARGALVAVQHTGDRTTPVPAAAATDDYAPALADTAVATAAVAGGLERRKATPTGTDEVDTAPTAVTGDQHEDGVERATRRTRRHQARLASALDRLVAELDDGTGDRLGDLRDELDAALADLDDELAGLEARLPPEGTVETLESSVADLEATLAELEADVTAVQQGLAGLDDESVDAAGDALGSVATDALQSDIDDVEQGLASRIESLWEELDSVNDELVDLSARVGDVPDIEREVAQQADTVEQLAGDTADLQRSLTALSERLDEVEQQAAAGAALDAVQSDLNALAADLDQLETAFETLDRADPATVRELGRDLDALRETVVDHAKRLEGVERTVSDLDDRITQAFQDTAKAEALSSLQAEVSRIRESASDATETATDAAETAAALDDTVETLDTDIDQLRQTVDGLAESSATRSEVTDLQTRVDDLDAQQRALRNELGTGGLGTVPVTLLTAGIAGAGVLGALLAVEIAEPVFAAGFAVLVVGPAIWLWFSLS